MGILEEYNVIFIIYCNTVLYLRLLEPALWWSLMFRLVSECGILVSPQMTDVWTWWLTSGFRVTCSLRRSSGPRKTWSQIYSVATLKGPGDRGSLYFDTYGYGSIPIDTFLVGWTSIYQLFWCELQGYKGFDALPYNDIHTCFAESNSVHLFEFEGAYLTFDVESLAWSAGFLALE